jgi:ferric-dicitrate binding protein FerR (iron transport regulator)
MSDELLVKYMLAECTETESVLVKQWLAEHPDNEAYFRQFERIWAQSKIQQTEVSAPDTDASWLKLRPRLRPQKSVVSYRTFYYAAAAVLLLAGLFTVYRYTLVNPIKKQIPEMVSVPHILKADAQTRIDTLSDRSVVTLNKHAVLHYPTEFAAAERRVKLDGEAFFSITPDKAKPFFIDASNQVEIRVVGTSFNVKSFDAYTEVIVETGIVEVRKFNRVILLHPHEKARIDKEDSTIVVQKNTDNLYQYFRSKEFECDNTPLWKVVEVLNEAYGDSVIIGRSDLKGLTLTTRFDNESLEKILEIISETFEISVEKKGKKYILK